MHVMQNAKVSRSNSTFVVVQNDDGSESAGSEVSCRAIVYLFVRCLRGCQQVLTCTL